MLYRCEMNSRGELFDDPLLGRATVISYLGITKEQ